MDELKAKNMTPQEPPPLMVQITAEEWKKLSRLLRDMQALDSSEWSAERAIRDARETMEKVTSEQTATIRKASDEAIERMEKAANNLSSRVGSASEKACDSIESVMRGVRILLIVNSALLFLGVMGVLVYSVLAGLGLVPAPF